MFKLRTRPGMLIPGMMSIFAVGCITGTNTFSNATVPVTRYCSVDETVAGMYDFPVGVERSQVKSHFDRDDAGVETVSLAP